jgi:hypothetical protein
LRINEAFAKDGPGIYRSTDKGDTWTLVPGSDVSLWPKDITVDPTDSKIIYLGACNTEGKETAGLYRTKDGGVTWKLLANKGAQHFGAFLHPQHPGWIYMTVCEGAPDAALWLSTDDGETWQPMYGMPFSNAQRVVVDPSKDGTIWVATFGGSVWHGPERP